MDPKSLWLSTATLLALYRSPLVLLHVVLSGLRWQSLHRLGQSCDSGERERQDINWLLKLLLRNDTYHFCLHFLAKVSHVGRPGFNRMGLSNSAPERGSTWIWTIVHSSLQGNTVKRFLSLFKELGFTMLGGRGKKHRKECFLNDKDPLLLLMVGADFQLGFVRFWVCGLDLGVHTSPS